MAVCFLPLDLYQKPYEIIIHMQVFFLVALDSICPTLVNFICSIGQYTDFPVFIIINKIFAHVNLHAVAFLSTGRTIFLKACLKKLNSPSKDLSQWYIAEIYKSTAKSMYNFLKVILWSASQTHIREQSVTFYLNLWVMHDHTWYRVCSPYRNLSKRITFS